MSETIHIAAPGGPIDILGHETDSSLLIDKVPYQFNFLREIGTTLRYQIARSINEPDLIQDREFSKAMKYGLLPEDTMSNTFKYTLSLLAPGDYKLELTVVDPEIELLELQQYHGPYCQTDTYGGMVEIIATQSDFNELVIHEYEELIDKGNEPIMILLTGDTIEDNYILDGHHKFVASGRLKKSLKALQITKLNPSKIQKDFGLKLISQFGPVKTEYIRKYTETQ